MRTLAILAMAAWLSGTASAQMISSDPEFARQGKKQYACTTPLGRNVICNRWHFPRTGWKKLKVTRNQTVFGKAESPEAHDVKIPIPPKKHIALYDYLWADHRDLSVLLPVDFDAATEELINRQLDNVEFQQFVEIKKAGTYRMSSCMAGQFFEDHYEMPGIRDGGIQVTLEQFTGRPEGPIVHMALPKKATWHYDENFEIQSTGVTWVQTFDDLPETAERGAVYAIIDTEQSWVYDGNRWTFASSPFMDEVEVDSYVGHAGLRTAYHIPTWWDDAFEMDAEWSCYQSEMALSPGFYVLRGNILPVWRDESGFLYSDYSGFAAIRELRLERVTR